jgi:hypothetical protein
MVHLWVSLQNNRIKQPCLNKRVERIFRDRYSFFYGDYNLNIYIAGKEDYESLEEVVKKVTNVAGGWVSGCKQRKCVEQGPMRDIIGECGHIIHRSLPKLFPRRDNAAIWDKVQFDVYRCDGNFKMFAWESARFYYVLCFDTS